jgi:hypothetical protein
MTAISKEEESNATTARYEFSYFTPLRLIW